MFSNVHKSINFKKKQKAHLNLKFCFIDFFQSGSLEIEPFFVTNASSFFWIDLYCQKKLDLLLSYMSNMYLKGCGMGPWLVLVSPFF